MKCACSCSPGPPRSALLPLGPRPRAPGARGLPSGTLIARASSAAVPRLKWVPARPRGAENTRTQLSPGSSVDWELHQPSELQRLINNIPYRRLCIWSVVAIAAWQLHAFFGVSGGVRRAHAAPPGGAQADTGSPPPLPQPALSRTTALLACHERRAGGQLQRRGARHNCLRPRLQQLACRAGGARPPRAARAAAAP
jgi:hypothetical protein